MATTKIEYSAPQLAAAANIKNIWGSIIYNVKDTRFAGGAKGDGVTDDTVAIQSAINAAIAKNAKLVFFPSGTYLTGTLTNTGSVYLVGDNATTTGVIYTIEQFGKFNGGFINGNTQFNNYVLMSDTNALKGDITLEIRRTTSDTTGSFNDIGNGIGISTVVNAGVNHAEFVISSVIDAYNTSSAGQVALISKGNKRANVPVWGANLIAQDYTGNASGTQGMFGLEVNIDADAADTNNNRKAVYISSRRNGVAGTAEFYVGVEVAAEANATFKNGFLTTGAMTTAINIKSSHTIGIDFASSTSAANITQIRLRDYDKVAMDTAGIITMRYHAGNDFIEFLKSGVRVGYINMAGTDHAL